MLTSDALRIRADAEPRREVFRCGEGCLTYIEWHRKSSALALRLIEQGVREQECVLLSFPLSEWISYVVALLAVQKAGAIAVSLPSQVNPSTAKKIISLTEARHGIGETAFPGISSLVCDATDTDQDPDFRVPVDPNAIAEIITTSGTTGSPKLVACPHGNLTWGTLSAAEAADRYGDEVVQFLSHPPIGSNAAQRAVTNALRGTPCLYNIPPSFDPVMVSRLIANRSIEQIAIVPAAATALLRVCQGMSFHAVTRVYLTAAFTPPWVASGLVELFPNATIFNNYGLTEGGGFRIGGSFDSARPGRVGRPLPGHSVRITDDAGNTLPAGTPGTLWVRDSTPYKRFYYRDDSGTEDARSADGWICTNDVAILEEDGRVTLVGRTNDIANVGGLKVALQEVDEEVATIDGVLDCAAFLLPHRTTGDMICMGIVCAPEHAANLEKAKTRLAQELGYRSPRLWMNVTDIPRTATGKVKREALAEMARARYPELDNSRGRG